MKIATIVVRVLLGALMVFASGTYFSGMMEPPELSGGMKTFSEGLDAAIYLMPLVKGIELICGLALLAGRFVPLATALLAPIAVNILGVHIFLEPEGLPVAIFVVAATIFLAYVHRERFGPLLKP